MVHPAKQKYIGVIGSSANVPEDIYKMGEEIGEDKCQTRESPNENERDGGRGEMACDRIHFRRA